MIEQLILVDGSAWAGLLPMTYLKRVAELRAGILTQVESWQLAMPDLAVGYVNIWNEPQGVIPNLRESECSVLVVNSALLASPEAVTAVRALKAGECLVEQNTPLAWCANPTQLTEDFTVTSEAWKTVEWAHTATAPILQHPYDLFLLAERAIRWDFARLTASRTSAPLSHTVGVIGGERIFLEPGARAEFCTLNASEGPIYIGKDAEIQEGAHIRGAFALGEGATVKMGAKIYGATSIGPHCKVGGEVSNSSFQEYSNKGHDGYIGNAAIGSWCNLGADTNCSNLKNDYSLVRVWDVNSGRFAKTGLQFCGLIMGDHSKSGINTMFNTGSVVGAFCNIFGDGFPRAWIPPFSWGGAGGLSEHPVEKAIATARTVMARRGVALSESMEKRIRQLFSDTTAERPYKS